MTRAPLWLGLIVALAGCKFDVVKYGEDILLSKPGCPAFCSPAWTTEFHGAMKALSDASCAFDKTFSCDDPLSLMKAMVESQAISASYVGSHECTPPLLSVFMISPAIDGFCHQDGGYTRVIDVCCQMQDAKSCNDSAKALPPAKFPECIGQPGTVKIVAEAINQDDPKTTAYSALSGQPPFDQAVVYGSSVKAIADKLRLRAVATQAAASYTWTVTGPGADKYTPSSAQTWDVGAIAPQPGVLGFQVDVAFADGSGGSASVAIEVGVRTKDVVVIGWIDAGGVPLSTQGVSASLLRLFPADGITFLDTVGAAAFLGGLATGTLPPPATEVDRTYVLNWMFKFAPNPEPPPSFASEAALQSFIAAPTGYKLFNRLQVKYRTRGNPVFLDAPVQLKPDGWLVGIGTTINPMPLDPHLFPGVATPGFNGKMGGSTSTISRINSGSPDAQAVAAFNRLASPHNIFWNDIGSRITLGVEYVDGTLVEAQLYPTYYLYTSDENGGLSRGNALPEAPQPIGNFTAAPFPLSGDLAGLLRRKQRL